MVINSTNMNKTNNQLSSLLNTKKIMTLEIQVLAGYRHKNIMGLNQLMESQPSPHDYWISNSSKL